MPLRSVTRGRLAASLATDAVLAFRNVFRQGHRSRGAVAAVVFGVAAYLLAAGFIDWTLRAMREETIHTRIGHLQVFRTGYFDRGTAAPWDYLVPRDAGVEEALRRLPAVREIAPRLEFTGLASHGETTVSFLGEGVDARRETALMSRMAILAGHALSADDPTGIFVGQGLAAALGAKVGDRVVLLASTRARGLGGVDATVRGIFTTASKAYDDHVLRAPLALAQRLVRASGVHKWVVLLDRTEAVPDALRELRPRLAALGFEVRPWTDFADFYLKTARLFERQVTIVQLIIALIIVLSISNSMTMAVMERTAEIGTSLALGVPRVRVLRRFVSEGLLLGVGGGLLGALLGWLLALAISAVGIPMPPPPGMAHGYVARITVTPGLVADALLLALATALLASLYPASRAARLSIVDALRHGR